MNQAETTIQVAGAKLTVPTESLFKAWMTQTIEQAPKPSTTENKPPRIGEIWPDQGGIYAGIIRGENGAPDYHLIHASAVHELAGVNWNDACDETAVPIEGHTDWSLPNRREARLLYINTPESFDTSTWYWTSTQYAAHDSYARMQNFFSGTQSNSHKSHEYRARAVRRLSIIE